MRKIITLILLFGSLCASAQLEKGVNQLGGVISIASADIKVESTGEKRNRTILSLNPSVGTFYRKNRLVGAHLIYYRTFESASNNETRSIGGGVYLRQYKALGKSGFMIFAQEKLTITSSKYFNSVGTSFAEMRSQSVAIGVVPALAYGVTKRFQVELFVPDVASVQFQHSSPKESNTTQSTTNEFSFSTGLSASIFNSLVVGVTWLF